MDTDGDLWLFGGWGYPESDGDGTMNDFWRFNITSKEWAWISGNKTIVQNGVYGTKGVPDTANYPGGRFYFVSWTDTDENLWIFGGRGYTESNFGWLNDLWKSCRFKDSIAPIITINNPTPNELFSSTAPGLADCNVQFSDGSGVDARWYMLINGTDNTDYTNNYSWNGEVDQFVWDYMDNGTVIIRIFANDSLGNIGMAEVIVRKDILGPIITINNPTPNELFSSIAPDLVDCNVQFSDGSGIAAQWYMLINGTDNTDYTDNYTWNGGVDQFVWDYMDNGTVIIRIFANDSLGNIGMAEVIVRKDIEEPSPPDGELPPSDGNDDDDGKKPKEGFDLVEFLTSPIGLAIIGGSGGVVVAVVLIIKKRKRAYWKY